MAGSIDKLLDHLNRALSTRERLLESRVQKEHNEAIMKAVTYLRSQTKERDIDSMLAQERLILTHSLEFDANSHEEKNSLQNAIAQLDECRICFKALAANPAAYKEMAATYPLKKKEGGLPIDAAKDFFRSHSTRLGNILSGKSSEFEKRMVRQRKENLQIIKDVYVELQRKALGMEASAESKE
jgi:hypothetical protein